MLKKGQGPAGAAARPSRSLELLVGALAVAGGLHVLLRTSGRGVALSADSLAMWSASANLLAGEGLVDFAGDPLTLWPPLFSLVLAAASWSGLDPFEAGRWLNAAAFAATVLLTGLWLAKLVRSPAIVIGGVLAVVVSYPLNRYAAYLLTEPLTILFMMGALFHLDRFLHRRPETSALLGAGAFAGLSAATRYAGVATIVAGVVALLFNRGARLGDRLRHALAFGAVSSAPLAAALARNWAVSGTMTGDRADFLLPERGVLDGVVSAARALSTWVVPGAGPEWLDYLPWIVAAAAPFVVAAVLVAFPGAWRGGRVAAVPAPDPAARTCLLFSTVYVVVLFATVGSYVGQMIDSRYLLPSFVPLVAAGSLLADRFVGLPARGRNAVLEPAVGVVAVAGFLIHLGFAMHKNIVLTAEWIHRGDAEWAAYNSNYWDGSETLSHVAGKRLDSMVYSNHASLLWYHDDAAPPGTYRNLPTKASRLARELDSEGSIVWFDNLPVAEYDVAHIAAVPGVEALADWSDGNLLRASSGASPP